MLRTPEVLEYDLADPHFRPPLILLASDGLWEFKEGSEDTAKIVLHNLKSNKELQLSDTKGWNHVLETAVEPGCLTEWKCQGDPADDTFVIGMFFRWYVLWIDCEGVSGAPVKSFHQMYQTDKDLMVASCEPYFPRLQAEGSLDRSLRHALNQDISGGSDA
uniref:PPM-type phosphatase domain-containing protein n=1 Tax=Chromera velia CCMP2878 TaxID=1169474 RepID=A0A0G4IAN1_9ALVE|eukprot:Cvel_12630.t1-p1 / transcript=Cvel_12630.t1 / gene=Cvel_12630 / organism=Chromera_velia_CCMP2878 / gene_product=hypothetical protein / transcript_product=hypothetical protein / location=Cvel_scaffold833:52074-52553(+) / protein_length=160 / sequence_SO=supercontig / SO=protein_coding / is_pseudo=false